MRIFTKDSIQLTKKSQDQLKKGEHEVYQLINRLEKKFEKAIMIGGGICHYNYGLSYLILLKGTLNEFAYSQALLDYHEDIDNLNKVNNINIKFEKDRVTAHTSKSNTNLIKQLF